MKHPSKKILFLIVAVAGASFFVSRAVRRNAEPRVVESDIYNFLVRRVGEGKRADENFFKADDLQDQTPHYVRVGNNLLRPQWATSTEIKDGIKYGLFHDELLISSDFGKTWDKIILGEQQVCEYGYVKTDRLYCFSVGFGEMSATVFDERGTIVKTLQAPQRSFLDLIDVFPDKNTIWFVWRDERYRRSNIWAYIPIPHSRDPLSGPFAIFAGELRLDTLSFEEHLIQYGAYQFP